MRKRYGKKSVSMLAALALGVTSVAPQMPSVMAEDMKPTQPENLPVEMLTEDFEGESTIEWAVGGNKNISATVVADPDNPDNNVLKADTFGSPEAGVLYYNGEGAADWSNYTFECRMRLEKWTGNNPWDYIAPSFYVTPGDKTASMARYALKYNRQTGDFITFHGKNNGDIGGSVKSPEGYDAAKWHTIKVDIENGTFSYYLDGAEEPMLQHTDGSFSKGSIGFEACSADFYVDDIKVTRKTSGKVSVDVPAGEYSSAFDVTLTAGAGESIYYTMDGSDPTENGVLYNGSVRISGDCMLKAVAIAAGKRYGEISTWDYKVTSVDMPSVTPLSGRYKDSVTVTMNCATPDADIYYTIDGSTPDQNGLKYTEPFELKETATVKAVAMKEGMFSSEVINREYIITDDLVERRIYVAVDGNDVTGDGSENKPFATITRARDEVRKYNDDMMGDIEVLVKKGRYYVDEAITLDDTDSGKNGRQVIYKSADGIGTAEIVGGQEITGWIPTTKADEEMGLDSSLTGKVYKAELGNDKFEFNALYVENGLEGYGNGKAIMARTPNYMHMPEFPTQRGPYLYAGGPGGGYNYINWQNGTLTAEEIAGMKSAQTRGEEEIAQVYVWDGQGDWEWFSNVLPISEIDEVSRKLQSPVIEGKEELNRTTYCIYPGSRYYLQGNLAFMDVPGEYHYNKATGTLYYYPAENQKMEDLTVVAPKTTEIFHLEGTDKQEPETWADEPNPDKQVSNIVIDGFALKDTEFDNYFTHGWSYNLNEAGTGYAGIMRHSPESYGSTQPGGYEEVTDRVQWHDGAVTMINTNHITVQNCSIHNTGLWGVNMWRDNEYNIVQNCDIGYTGYGAITTDGGFPGVGKYNQNNTYYNLRLHHAGQNLGHTGTVTVMSTGQSTFSHLDIRYSPRRTLTMLGAWSRRNSGDDNYNAYRDIYTVGNLFEYINCYGGEQDSGEDSGVFFAMLFPKSWERLQDSQRNYMNQILIDHTGGSYLMHDKNTSHGMEFAMGVNGMTISNVKGVNSQSNTLALYYHEDANDWEIENCNSNYYDENIFDDPEYFDDSKMEYDQIGTTKEFPFAPEWDADSEEVQEDLYFSEDFESGEIDRRKWTIESGNPRINAANMAENPLKGRYSVELDEGSNANPAVLSRTFDQNLNKIVEVKFFDKFQDYAGSDKYGGRPNTNVRVDDGENIVAIGANGWESKDRYYYIHKDQKVWTDVQRVFGWHTFKFDYTSGTDVKLYIDDSLIATLPETDFNYVAMSEWSGNERQACYDQLKIYGGKEAPPAGDVPLPTPPEAIEGMLFEEDFESDTPAEFVAQRSTTTIEMVNDPKNAENKVMHVISPGDTVYYPGGTNWSEYTFECKLMIGEWGIAGNQPWDNVAPVWYAGIQDGKGNFNRYSLKYRRAGKDFALYRRAGGDSDMVSATAPSEYEGKWHDYKVSVHDGLITAYVDGNKVFEHKDSSNTRGTIGFDGINADYYVDDIKVTPSKTPNPSATVEGGTYPSALNVELLPAGKGQDIFYTLDGSDPTDPEHGLYYIQGEKILIDKTTTLKFAAVAEGMQYSEIVEIVYIIEDGKPVEERTFKITVDGKTETYKYNAPVTITAPVKDGEKFAGWEVNGEIISYKEVYKFYVSQNMSFKATYVPDTDKVTEEAKAMLTNVFVTKRADEKSDVKFVGELSLPEGYKLIEAGLVWSSKDTVLVENKEPNKDLKPTMIKKVSDTNQFSVTIKGMPKDRFIRGVIFAKVEDENGKQAYIFSDEEKAFAAQ